MSLSDRLTSSLSIIAAVVIAICLFVTAPAFGVPSPGCHTLQFTHQVAMDPEDGVTENNSKACCTQMQCCPILNEPPLPTLPNLSFDSLQISVHSERPLLLLAAIDPPPRFRPV